MTARDLAHTAFGVLGLWLVASQIPAGFLVIGSSEGELLKANWIAQIVSGAVVGVGLFAFRAPLARLVAPNTTEGPHLQQLHRCALAVLGAYLFAIGTSEFIPGVFVFKSLFLWGEGLTKALFGAAFLLLGPRLVARRR